MIINYFDKFNQIFLRSWRPFAWIIFVIFLVYYKTLFSGLVYLDDHALVASQYEFNNNLSNIKQAFSEDIFQTPNNSGSFYRPLLRLSFMLDAQAGQDVIIFVSHLTNICLHIIAILLLFIFLIKLNLNKSSAFLFSLLSGVHPLMTQSVSLIVGRNDTLLAIFVFLSFISFINFLEKEKLKYFFTHLFFVTLALLTKETALVLPLILSIYLLIFTPWKKIINNYQQYLTLAFAWSSLIFIWFLVRRLVLTDFIGSADYHVFISIYENIPSLIPAIGKVLLPFDLSVFPILSDMTMVYGVITIFALVSWGFISSRKNYRLIMFGLAWFFIFIILSLVKPSGTVPEFSENRIYLPALGFIFIIFGLGEIKLSKIIEDRLSFKISQKEVSYIVSVIIILTFSVITIYRNNYYRDGLSFWNNAVKTSPNFSFSNNNLGAMYYLNGQLDLAAKYFRRALELNRTEPMVHNNLGLIYQAQGRYDLAEKEYKLELESYPNYDKALFNLAYLYYQQEKFPEALWLFQSALRVNPSYYEASQYLRELSDKF